MEIIDPTILHTWLGTESVLCGEYPSDAFGTDTKIKELYKADFNVFIDLTHPTDGLTSYTQHIYRRLDRPVSYHSFPIVDGDIITNEAYAGIVYLMRIHALSNSKIYLHCWGGMGRTATVLACYFKVVEHSMKPEEALRLIDEAREGTSKAHRPAPQNELQINAIKDFYSHIDKTVSEKE